MAVEFAAGKLLFQPYDAEKPGRLCYFPIHDMESLWWISQWLLLNFDVSGMPQEDVDDRDEKVSILFMQTLLYQIRSEWLRQVYDEKLPVPTYYDAISELFCLFGQAMLQGYKATELSLDATSATCSPAPVVPATAVAALKPDAPPPESKSDAHAWALYVFQRCVELAEAIRTPSSDEIVRWRGT